MARKKPRKASRSRASKQVPGFGDGGSTPTDLGNGVFALPDQETPVADNVSINPATGAVTIENDDGSITVDPTGESLWMPPDDDDDSHFANLAPKVSPMERGRVAEELLSRITEDKQGRSQWEQMRAKVVELTGMKIEDAKSDVTRSALGMSTSVVRDPILLEAVERFRANAFAEMCPAAGPVKVINWADEMDNDGLADALEKDLNYYLTTTASEYYPDTRYMLWWTGLAGGTFKKVYMCPLRGRPVSEYVDGKDLIVPANSTDLKNATRITHQVELPRDVMIAMQLEGIYLDAPLGEPVATQINPVDAKVASIDGRQPQVQSPEDQPYTIYECYCKLNLQGFEHKRKGKPTGLPLPYRVTIEETSRQVLEIRRNWDQADEDETYRPAKIPFVLFPYSTGMSRIYGSGLGQMLGNLAKALTALMRISIDGGLLANYPAFIKAKGADRQISNEIMLPPGGCMEIDTGGLPIQQFLMPAPYKDVSAGVTQLIEQTRAVAQRLGGTADMPVGEGKQDAPVGTTLALIEQSTKIEGAVHKALHEAQSEEFRLLVELFKQDPDSLWKGNRRAAFGNAQDDAAKQQRLDKFKRALDNCDIQPVADPNVPSDMHRKLLSLGFKQMTAMNPAYNQVKVDEWVARQVFKLNEQQFKSFLAPPQPPGAQMNPDMMKVMLQAQSNQLKQQQIQMQAAKANADRQSKENIEAMKMAQSHAAGLAQGGMVPPSPTEMRALELKQQSLDQAGTKMMLDHQNAHLDRQSHETVKAMDIAARVATHPESQDAVNSELMGLQDFMTPVNHDQSPDVPGGAPARDVGGEVSEPQEDSVDTESEHHRQSMDAIKLAKAIMDAMQQKSGQTRH